VRDEREEAALKPLPAALRPHGYGTINQRIMARLRSIVQRGVDLVVVSDSKTVKATGATLLHQRGGTFGERITNAITDTLACGYDEAVVVGNDCPTIAAGDLLAAFERLSEGAPVVAAPAFDGGAFLVGARTGFDSANFAALPWQTSQLFAAFRLLDGSATLSIVRDDFDSWSGNRAQQALLQLLGNFFVLSSATLPSFPLLSRATVKARTRIFLTAPPSAH
jgi:hypothetical protein